MSTKSSMSANSKPSTKDVEMKQDSDVVSVCSKASITTFEDENDDLIDEKVEGSFSLPESDQSYHRRIFIMKSCSNTGEIHHLPHPKFARPIDKEGNPFEIMKIEQGQKHSIFVGDSVVSDPGPMLLFLPVHPLFLVLPILENFKENFLSLDELFDQSPLHLLSNSEKLQKALVLVAESHEDSGSSKFRLNEEKLIDWLKIKFESLKEAVRKNVNSIEGSDDCFLNHYSISILSDYLSPSIEELLRYKLELKKEDGTNYNSTTDSTSRKRIFDQPASNKKMVPTKKRPSKFSQMATTGMQSLFTFFGQKQIDK